MSRASAARLRSSAAAAGAAVPKGNGAQAAVQAAQGQKTVLPVKSTHQISSSRVPYTTRGMPWLSCTTLMSPKPWARIIRSTVSA